MVKHYLLKQRQELIEQRIDCSNSLKECDLKIKENAELIRLIENSKDESYESFAPLWSYHSSNEEKIKELDLEREKLEEKREEFLSEFDCVNQKIEELDCVIKAVQESDRIMKVMQESQKSDSEKPEEENDIYQQELRLETLETQEKEDAYQQELWLETLKTQEKEDAHQLELRSGVLEAQEEEDAYQQELWLEALKTQEEEDAHQQELQFKTLETQEYKRQQIAKEIQDTTMQELTSVLHKLELCVKLSKIDPNRCKLELQALSHAVKNMIEDLQKIIYDL